VTVLALDSATAWVGLRDTWGGRVGASQRSWLVRRLRKVETPVVALHHPLATLTDCPDEARWRNFRAGDAGAVATMLRAHDVPLVVSAHHHVPAVANHGDTTEVLAPATCSFPQASLHVEIDPRGTTLRLVPLADRAGLAEAHGLARNGKPLGRVVLGMTERRLADLRGRPVLGVGGR